MSPHVEKSGSSRPIKHLTDNGGGDIEEEFDLLSKNDKAVVISIMTTCTANTEKVNVILPLEFIVFPSEHDPETKQGAQRIEYERNCMIAFKKSKVREHVKKSILDRLKKLGLKATQVTFEIADGKRIKVTAS